MRAPAIDTDAPGDPCEEIGPFDRIGLAFGHLDVDRPPDLAEQAHREHRVHVVGDAVADRAEHLGLHDGVDQIEFRAGAILVPPIPFAVGIDQIRRHRTVPPRISGGAHADHGLAGGLYDVGSGRDRYRRQLIEQVGHCLSPSSCI